jgi:single-stranded-DNA-specific exonuclease
MEKKWIIHPEPPTEFVNSHPELLPIITRLLWNRNLRTQEQIDEFLHPDYSADVHDPFLFQDMKKAVKIIFKALDKKQKIIVHGDYDADGVCASAILINTLKALGASNVDVFIPHRQDDGYGINPNTVKLFIEQKIDLLITCDCGISNYEEVRELKKFGASVIITDHHTPPKKLPPADAIIHTGLPNEKYPDKGLAGAAVAFKLAQGLLKKDQLSNNKLNDELSHEGFEKWLLDLVAIATIGDMVPLVGESRTLTKYGLTVLNKTKNIGLKQLLINASILDDNGARKKGVISSEKVSYQIVPRLNAAGRMDHANTAFALLSATNDKEAVAMAEQLCKNNSDRQKITEQFVNLAIKHIKETGQENNPVLFYFKEDLPLGLAGLISGKLKDNFSKPSFAMGVVSDKEIAGSARSIPQFNLMDALKSMEEIFSKYGGHPMACGFSLKEPRLINEFQLRMIQLAKIKINEHESSPQIFIDALIDLENVDWKLYDILQKFEPFGVGNEEPIYAAKNITITEISPVGQDGKHLRLTVKHNSNLTKKLIAFGFGDSIKHPSDWKSILSAGDKIDIAFTVHVNEWNGNRELQLTVEDIKKQQ